ncbi:hypothetical protein GE061_016134 [Apolygus lucorum]|uniref:Uncharacterized protein n=1 Tax=Apolygus lucorum TaxID=248454 RepID=A0A8S9XFC9_APOLU|nr:hypothetical protein GE061_016134 [Apolygus lucorum]
MKAAFVITLIAVINYARTVHTKDKTNIQRKQSHSSQAEGSQSLVISSEAKLTNENVSAFLPEPYDMDMLDGSDLNEDESFVLVPLKKLVKNPRKPRDTSVKNGTDPLYVMIPYKELSRKSKDFGGPINIIAMDDRVALKRDIPDDAISNFNVKISRQKRKEKSVVRPRRSFNTGKTSKRNFKYPFFNTHGEDSNVVKVADSESLWEVPLAKYSGNGANPYAFARDHKSTYKSKKSLGANDLQNQLRKELSSSVQEPRIYTEFKDLNPKTKDIQNIMSKQRKSPSKSPVNITMYISNLIPPNEVENTKITNSGKLFKSGCLKFSIQLEKPGGMSHDDCCAEDCCNESAVPQRVGCGHIERESEAKNGVNTLGIPSGSSGKSGCWNTNSPQQSGTIGCVKAQGAHVTCAVETTSRIESDVVANRDVTSLLMKLMGLEKKPARKPVLNSPAQAVLMDSDIVKELQRLLVTNQGSTPASADSIRANHLLTEWFAEILIMMMTSSTQPLSNPRARSRMDIYVPGIVLRSIMSCGGPSFFLQRSDREKSMAVNGVKIKSSPYQMHEISSKELPDSKTVTEWLKNGSMNRDKLQNVKEGKLRKLITTSTDALPLIKKSFQVAKAPESKPSEASWPVNHSKVARCQQRKLENNDEENFIKEALQGLIIEEAMHGG